MQTTSPRLLAVLTIPWALGGCEWIAGITRNRSSDFFYSEELVLTTTSVQFEAMFDLLPGDDLVLGFVSAGDEIVSVGVNFFISGLY